MSFYQWMQGLRAAQVEDTALNCTEEVMYKNYNLHHHDVWLLTNCTLILSKCILCTFGDRLNICSPHFPQIYLESKAKVFRTPSTRGCMDCTHHSGYVMVVRGEGQ